MRRFAIPLTIAATLGIAVTLFHLKQQVGDLEKELTRVNRAIVTHREVIQVMRSEWSYLNRPARIAELAEKHLGMRRSPPTRMIYLEDLPRRAAAGNRSESALLAAHAPGPARDRGKSQ